MSLPPAVSSKMSIIFSRSRKPYMKAVTAPISMHMEPHPSRWEAMRVSSSKMVRMTTARSGTSICSAFSQQRQKACRFIVPDR